ncbi:hypothetical protein BT63DRAFT_453689 [Microthyrium microscopicum]|uniref:G-patch domain-containing protein n=1 Tax=Microthyrium microscopicum TaxID=703497 RepID=A0A6A6UJP6_9PEZI|nr:hypothetical protein BT63DRAFT_453689 [Microthyrium microscopicum]
MGLAGPKKRAKIGHDPNNTNWSSNTTRFGHKVLSAQGWTPGAVLGASSAAHAEHYTAASASHIRVVLRDGNRGLGSERKKGGMEDESFGLNLLSGILGRLNGKSEEVLKKEEGARRDIGLQRYMEGKWGGVGFTFGGYLVGDRIEKTEEAVEEARVEQMARLKALKRPRDEHDEVPQKRSKKSKRAVEDTEDVKKSKKSQKRKTEVPQNDELPANTARSTPVLAKDDSENSEDPIEIKRRRKEEKRARKEARRQKKEQKKSKASTRPEETATSDMDLVQSANDRQTTGTSTPSAGQSGSSTPLFAGGRGRHAIRQRYIQQKRMACLDDKALNEIFMIKSNA